MLIREERPGDEDAIHRLTSAAFEPMPFSDGTEVAIIRSLRSSGDLTLSLVAEEEGAIIGHVAFSPVSIDGAHNNWFGLGPISVESAMQRRGIGKALILKGFEILKKSGARGCALIGNPDVYKSSGFESDGHLTYGDLNSKYVQRIVFAGDAPRGELKFAPAFEAGSAAG